MKIYDFKVREMNGGLVPLKAFSGKVLLIVNTATQCGFTPTYTDLQALYQKLEPKGLVILDFPCDQFGHQAPGADADIHAFCTNRFGVTFPQFAKLEVNGEHADPLFQYLASHTKFGGFNPEHKLSKVLDEMLSKADPDYASKSSIKWNFTKFLIDRNGKLVKRFEPTAPASEVEAAVAALL